MGYMLAVCFDNAFRAAGVRRPAVALLIRTVVDGDDPAFFRPSKPIGGAYDEAEARRLVTTAGWAVDRDGELAAYARQGQFAPGSMLPKVRALLRFLEGGGRRAVITTPELSEKALAGEAGTQVLP